MARLLPILLLALCSCAYAKFLSVVLVGQNCETNADCLSGDTCSYGSCMFSRRGDVKESARGLPDGSLCLYDKNCKNYCRKQRCTSKSNQGGPCESNDDCYGKMLCKNRKCEYQSRKAAAPKRVPADGPRNLSRAKNAKKAAPPPKKAAPPPKKAAPRKTSPPPKKTARKTSPPPKKRSTQKKQARPVARKEAAKKSAAKNGTARKPYKKPDGKRCTWNAECQNTCIFGKCSRALRAGGICAFSSNCEGDLVCKHSKCQRDRTLGQPNGSTCKWDFQCLNVCILGKCEERRALGQMCIKNIHCEGVKMCRNGKCALPANSN